MKQKEIKVIFERSGENYLFELMPYEQFTEEVQKTFSLQQGTYSILSYEKKIEIRNTEELKWYGQGQGILISQQKRVYSPVPHLNLSQIQNKKQYSIIKKTQIIKSRLNQTIKNLKETHNSVTYRSISPEENWKKLQEKTQIMQEQAQRFANKREEMQSYSDRYQSIIKSLLKEMLAIQNENVMYSKRNDGLQQSISQVQMMLNLQKKQMNQLKQQYPGYDMDKFIQQIKCYKYLQKDLMVYLQELDNILQNNEINDGQNAQYQLLQIMKELKKMQ